MLRVTLLVAALVVAPTAMAQGVTITQAPQGTQTPQGTQAPKATEGAQPEADAPRYAMRATEEGTVRLDTRTGAVSLCTTTGGRLKCAVGADERAAYRDEIDRLDGRLAALEGRLAKLERNGGTPGDAGGPAASALTAEDEERIDRAVGVAERAMRGFAGVVKRLRRDLEE